MSEPIYVAQTFDEEHVVTGDDAQAWWRLREREARAEGCTFFRYSIKGPADDLNPFPEASGLLIEGWRDVPSDQGEPRWTFATLSPQQED